MENLTDQKQTISQNQHPQRGRSMVIGLLIVAFGLLYMLHNLDVLDHKTWRAIFSWPMLLVAIGIVNLADRKTTWGLILLAVGGAFLIDRFYDLPFNLFTFFWPAVLIIIGVGLIMSNSSNKVFTAFHRIRNRSSVSDTDQIEDVAVFGGSERYFHSLNFKGGEMIAIFGGSKIDLTQCKLAPGENKLEMIAIFGGTTLIVPNDWNIIIKVVPVFGGFTDKRYNLNVDHTKTLIIDGVAIFGGGELKSY
ncbi:MAG: cell wall-active antibiotics response protein [Lentimicrobium sp.]|nr:cell wall-active antibiotics response protein [Lentimicrobium sp.]